MEWLTDFLTGMGGTAIIGIVTFFLTSAVKKGNFENWGIAIGKKLSAIGRGKLGKATWEKIEDVILIAFVTFSHGLKKGADMDDKVEEILNGNNNKEGG